MDWIEYTGARQMLLEERIGTRVREEKAIEDAKAKAAMSHTTQR